MINSPAGYHFFFGAVAFLLGAVVGSFLNVCIYRLPLDLSVNEPRRSFCPACKKQLAWYHNFPLLSWLFLRGRCAYCGSPIPFRYFAVELLTAAQELSSATFQYTEPLAAALVYYLVIVSILMLIQARLERRFTWTSHQRRRTPAPAVPAVSHDAR